MHVSLLVALLSVIVPAAAQQPLSPDADGFIRNWLILAPIAIVGESGATEIDRDFLKGEAAIKPKADDKVVVGGAELAWKPHQTSDYFIDFLQSFGKEHGEYVAGYAVTYVIADEDMKVTLALSTNDQGKAWLNGKEVFKFADTRVLDKDTDRVDVTLAKGQNVLVLKVINEVNNWQGCARFLQGGAPVKTLRIATAPQGAGAVAPRVRYCGVGDEMVTRNPLGSVASKARDFHSVSWGSEVSATPAAEVVSRECVLETLDWQPGVSRAFPVDRAG